MPDMPDPSTLTDEELDNFLESGTFPEPKEEPKPDEPKPEDKKPEKKPEEEPKPEDKKEKPEADPEKPVEAEEETPEPKPAEDEAPKPSRREAARIRDLLEKYGQPEDKPKETVKPTGIDYEKELDADPETIKRLEADRQAAADTQYDRGLEQAKSIHFLTRLEIDAPRVEAKYPQLDKNSDDFKPEAANDVNLLYLQLTGYNPTTKMVKNADIRYSDFADTIFTLVNDLAEQRVETTTKQIKKQAAQTGIRPDGSASKMNLDKAPHEMTDEELDARIALAIPKR